MTQFTPLKKPPSLEPFSVANGVVKASFNKPRAI
jgi:hypothetical protein